MSTVHAGEGGPPTGRGTSILVFGTGENPMAILAAALARRTHIPFGWANCSGSTSGLDLDTFRFLEATSESNRELRVDPRDLTPFHGYGARLGHLVEPGSIPPEDRTRLDDYFRLPLLLQRWLARTTAPSGATSLLLTNADGLPPSIVTETLGQAEVHRALRREQVTLAVTFRGVPPNPLRDAFDAVFRTESGDSPRWTDSVVTIERGDGTGGMPSPASLRELLPWLGLTPDLLTNPSAGLGHHLR